MNFLAHIFLSGDQPHLIVGNFLADYLNNKEVAALPGPIQEGIRLHRKIDAYTDQHPMVKRGVERMRPAHRKFAPVVLDICFDYVLVKNWSRYSVENIHLFTKKVYEVLQDHSSLMPHKLQERLPMMIADDWLTKYGTVPGLRYTFKRMKYRTEFPEYFIGAVDNFLDDYDSYENEFNQFFPDLIKELKHWHEQSK
ncbi:MAG: ACP phosphodiesterase [Bacteroidota bacterium]